jgi:hypothetical protein
MKSTSIIQGNFAKSAGNKGNFTAYNAQKEQIFINKALVATIGITNDATFKPFFALISERMITPFDANGVPMAPTPRLEATSVFLTEDELIKAELADYSLEIKKQVMKRQMLETAIKSAELDESSVHAILSASSFL